MHGATLLDARRPRAAPGDPVERRPQRARSAPSSSAARRAAARITGNLAMPGFTAPKLLWVAAHEPEIFARTARVLLPKDYLRLRLTGEYASDMSDAAGTLWLDVGAPRLVGRDARRHRARRARHAAAGRGLRADRHAARRPSPHAGACRADAIVAGGGGDNAAGAVGIGVVRPGDAFLSLGTSGVYFVAGDRFAPAPERRRARLLPLPARHLAPDVGDPQRRELPDAG